MAASDPALPNEPSDEDAQAPGRVRLTFKAQDGSEVAMRVYVAETLQRAMAAYGRVKAIDLAAVRFFYDGQRLNPTNTPQDLEMEDGDEIDVMLEQTGGVCAGNYPI